MDKLTNTEAKRLAVRSGITCVGLGLCCGLTAILLYTVGYQLGTSWNNDAIETRCKVLEHNIDTRTCRYQCNCYQSCSGSGSSRSCRQVCQTCYYTCYDGEVKYEYFDYKDKSHTFWETEYSGYRSKNNVKNSLEENYKIGSKRTCYYQKHDTEDVKFELINADGYFISSMVFFAVWAFLAVLYCCLEMIFLIRKNITSIKSFGVELKNDIAHFI